MSHIGTVRTLQGSNLRLMGRSTERETVWSVCAGAGFPFDIVLVTVLLSFFTDCILAVLWQFMYYEI